MMNVSVHGLNKKDYDILPLLLYEAIFVPEGNKRPDKDIIYKPELSCYYENFGRKGDIGFIARTDEKIIGACWVRLFQKKHKGYGYISDDIPELCIALYNKYRNQGIGTLLLSRILNQLKTNNAIGVSLSVDKANKAIQLYKNLGFIIYDEDEKTAVMIKNLI